MVYSEEEKEVEHQRDDQSEQGEDSAAEVEAEGSDLEMSGVMSGVQDETQEELGTLQESHADTGKTPSRTAIGAQPQPIRHPDQFQAPEHGRPVTNSNR